MSAPELGNAKKLVTAAGSDGVTVPSSSQRKGKSGLSSVTLAPNELSSKYGGKRDSESKFSNITIRLLRATNLLASDVDTGKSDPTGFAWIGNTVESPSKFGEIAYNCFWYHNLKKEKIAYEYRDSDQYEMKTGVKIFEPLEEVKRSKTIRNTLSPNWNEDLVFNDIDIADFDLLFNLKCIIIIRDEDNSSTGDSSVFQDLGAVSIPFRDIILANKDNSRVTKTGVTYGPQTIPLGPTSGNSRHHGHKNIERGTLTFSISISFDEKDENEKLLELRKNLSQTDEMIPIAELVTVLRDHFAKKKEDVATDMNNTITSTLDRKRAEMEIKQLAKSAKRATTPSKVQSSRNNSSRGQTTPTSPRSEKSDRDNSRQRSELLEDPVAGDESDPLVVLKGDQTAIATEIGANENQQLPFSTESFKNMTRELNELKERLKITEAKVVSGDQNAIASNKLEQQLPTISEKKPLTSTGKGTQEAESMMPELSEGDQAENIPEEKVVPTDMTAKVATKEEKLNSRVITDASVKSDLSTSLDNKDGTKVIAAPNIAEVKTAVEMGLSDKAKEILPSEDVKLGTPTAGLAQSKADNGQGVAAEKGNGQGSSIISGAKIGIETTEVNTRQASSSLLSSPPLSDKAGTAQQPTAINEINNATNINNSNNGKDLADKSNQAKPTDVDGNPVAKSLPVSEDKASDKSGPSQTPPVATPTPVQTVQVPAVDAQNPMPQELTRDEANRGDENVNTPVEEAIALKGSGNLVIDGALKDSDIVNSSGSATSAARALREMAQQRDLLQKHLEDLTSVTTQGILALTKHIQQVEKKAESALLASSQSLNNSLKKQQNSTVNNNVATSDSIEAPELTQGDESTPEGLEDTNDTSIGVAHGTTGPIKGQNQPAAESKSISKRQATPLTQKLQTPAADSARAIASKKASAELAALRKERKTQLAASADFGTVEIISKGKDGEVIVTKEQLPPENRKSRIVQDPTTLAQPAPAAVSMALDHDLNVEVARGDEAGNYTDEELDEVETAPLKVDKKNSTNAKSSSSIIRAAVSTQQQGWSQPQLWSPKGIEWKSVEECIKNGDYRSCFTSVLDYGNLDDIVKLMELTGPKPEVLSVTLRNKVYENVCVLLVKGQEVEKCLVWVLALIRGQDSTSKGLIKLIARHTLRDLIESLEAASVEPSRRGLLASLLASQLEKSLNSATHKISTNEFLTRSGNLNLSRLP